MIVCTKIAVGIGLDSVINGSIALLHIEDYNKDMFDADVGGMPSGLCTYHEALPVWESADRRHMTVVKKSISAEARKLLSFILGREVDIVMLPQEQNLIAAFDRVMEACRTFQGTVPASFSQSAEEAIEVMERGEQPQCCKPPEITAGQVQLMEEIRTRYERFLAFFSQNNPQSL